MLNQQSKKKDKCERSEIILSKSKKEQLKKVPLYRCDRINFITDKSIKVKSYDPPTNITTDAVIVVGSSISCEEKLLIAKHKNHKQRSSTRHKENQQHHHQLQKHHLHYQDLNRDTNSKSQNRDNLFLNHLRESRSLIQFLVAGSDNNNNNKFNKKNYYINNSHAYTHYLRQHPTSRPVVRPRLPIKIYALYRHLPFGSPCEQVQQQQQLRLAGEIHLLLLHFRFRSRMLFAEVPASASEPPPTAAPASTSELIAGPNSHTNQVEIMEVMKKLDADLVALFGSEPLLEQQMKKKQDVWQQQQSKQQQQHQHEQKKQKEEDQLLQEDLQQNLQLRTDEDILKLFKQCNAIQLNLEALTLQPEGTQRMELVQTEIRPIFTVECQLSEELIKLVARYPMFHVMQFESEKFQSLTQCTRFNQMAQREVHFDHLTASLMEDNKLKDGLGFGHIDFTVWWREPGTCLNEMLGMGRLQLKELYDVSLLEQCKCIPIKRRNDHFASLYLKISLLNNSTLINNNNNAAEKDHIQSNNNTNTSSSSSSNNITSKSSAPVNNNINNNNNISRASSPVSKKNSNSTKACLDNINFMAETTKVRLLRGYIYAGEWRQLSATDATECQELSLKPFWQQQTMVSKLNEKANGFQLKEQFAIINDDKFLSSVERQQLLLELKPLGGLVKLPLHQFYIAYRDASITNHLCKGKMPVISIDGWAPIIHKQTQNQLGELKVLLAIGSETQIAQLKELRSVELDNQSFVGGSSSSVSRTTDLLDMLQNALTSAPPAPVVAAPSRLNTTNNFRFTLNIVGAAGLPLNPGYGKSSKKQAKRQAAATKRFPPNEPPNTYVTFQAINANTSTYKSHEGLVYATPIAEKSTTPQWKAKFQVEVSRDYLSNHQKLFILKLWKKANLSAGGCIEPTPLEDAIIGFAALNLATSSLPTGWHNIVDFNGRVTGGLEAHVAVVEAQTSNTVVDSTIEQFEQSLELSHLQLGQAIKRKFTELEEISQRLRTRLVDVTGETLKSPEFDVDEALDNWPKEDDADADDLVADFERALRTPTPTPGPPSSPQPAGQKE